MNTFTLHRSSIIRTLIAHTRTPVHGRTLFEQLSVEERILEPSKIISIAVEKERTWFFVPVRSNKRFPSNFVNDIDKKSYTYHYSPQMSIQILTISSNGSFPFDQEESKRRALCRIEIFERFNRILSKKKFHPVFEE